MRSHSTGVLLGAGFAFAVLLILVGTLSSPASRRDELWVRDGQIGLQFGAIVILGALVTRCLQRRDEQREDRRGVCPAGQLVADGS